jgi:hypothetical protein
MVLWVHFTLRFRTLWTSSSFSHGFQRCMLCLSPRSHPVPRESALSICAREELHSKLWVSDTFVDFDHGLNNAEIRDYLGATVGIRDAIPGDVLAAWILGR